MVSLALLASLLLGRSHDGVELARYVVVDDAAVVTQTARAQSRTIYLNRHGVTLTPGATSSITNRSSLISAPATIPPWHASDELWSETVTCVREMFAPFDVRFTETSPGNVPHIEAVFGGTSTMLGLPIVAGGVAPMSTSCKVIESSIVFAFTDTLSANAKTICEVMAQEIAHSYGLDHVLLAPDPMTYLSYAGKRSFQDTLAACGELTARPCGVPGHPSCRAMQNSYELLVERLGAAGAPPDEMPGDGAADAADDTGDADEVADAAALGCTAGHGAGWLVGLVVLGASVRRPRSRRARR
jgi:hypothetical protein